MESRRSRTRTTNRAVDACWSLALALAALQWEDEAGSVEGDGDGPCRCVLPLAAWANQRPRLDARLCFISQ